MIYREFEELLENSAPQARMVFDDGAYVVGGHKESGELIRLFRNDDMGFSLGAPLIPNREMAAEHAQEPDWVESLYRTLTAQCGWKVAGADMVTSLPGEMFFRHVEYLETAYDGTIVLAVGGRWESYLF